MDNLIQKVESTLNTAVTAITPKLNATASVTSNAVNAFLNWIAIHPKTSLVIIIFILGFLCGILF